MQLTGEAALFGALIPDALGAVVFHALPERFQRGTEPYVTAGVFVLSAGTWAYIRREEIRRNFVAVAKRVQVRGRLRSGVVALREAGPAMHDLTLLKTIEVSNRISANWNDTRQEIATNQMTKEIPMRIIEKSKQAYRNLTSFRR